jgi:hypothetical protein
MQTVVNLFQLCKSGAPKTSRSHQFRIGESGPGRTRCLEWIRGVGSLAPRPRILSDSGLEVSIENTPLGRINQEKGEDFPVTGPGVAHQVEWLNLMLIQVRECHTSMCLDYSTTDILGQS